MSNPYPPQDPDERGAPNYWSGSQGPGGMPPYQPYGQDPGQFPRSAQPADVGTRFLARLIDFVVVGFAFSFVVSFLLVGMVMGTGDGMEGLMAGDLGATGVLTSLLGAAVFLGYFTLMEANTGKTLGKMVTRLEVRGSGGGNPTMAEAAKRNAWTALGAVGIIPLIGGFLSWALQLAAAISIAVTISNDPVSRQGWHDRFADGTRVVKTA